DLTEANRARLEQLLEHDPVLTRLPCRDADRRHGLRNRRVTKDVGGARRLLDPPRIEWRELLRPSNRFVDVPLLVGVDHEPAVGANLLANDPQSADIVLQVAAHFDLEMGPPGGDALAAQSTDLLVWV